MSENLMPHYNPETRFMRYVPLTSRADSDRDVRKPRPAKRYREKRYFKLKEIA